MLVSNFRVEDDSTPYVFSMPPHIDAEGDEVAAYVSVRPFGKDSRDVAINMSIDEARPGQSGDQPNHLGVSHMWSILRQGNHLPDHRHGIAPAHSMCPSKPRDVAMSR